MSDNISALKDKVIDNETGEILDKQDFDRWQWAEAITARWQDSVETIIDVGQMLIEAKDSLPHGEFGAMCKDDLLWSPSTSRRLMSVARHPVLSNCAHGHNLPASWRTLYELTKLPEQVVEEGINNGDITPEITRRGVKRLEKPHVAHNSGENEWYTPPEYIEAARAVMGNIDLDPASTEKANEIVQADAFYTKEDDGLSKEWQGKVWMNPPYASSLIKQFTAKLATHLNSGDVPEAIVLVNNATETNWFNRLVSQCDCVCFPKGRVRFINPRGNPGAPLQGQAVLYAGDNTDSFIATFKQFGWIGLKK